MKHGQTIPANKRHAMARRALELFEKAGSRARGLEAIEDEFDVSNPTARNLVAFGRRLLASAND